jgi:hypothetical protein
VVDGPHTWLVHEDLPPRWAVADRFDPSGLAQPRKAPSHRDHRLTTLRAPKELPCRSPFRPSSSTGFVPVVDLSAASGSSAARAGRWASTLHRALNNRVDCYTEARISIPLFRQPNFDAVVEAQPSAPRDAAFQLTTSGAWLAAKSAADRRLA